MPQSIVNLPADELRLDDQNPRLPEEKLGMAQAELLTWLDDEEALDELAASMLANGFFQHEPLVVMASGGGAPYTVVEGNRRFATLSILLQLPSAAEAGLEFEFEVQPSDSQLDALRVVPCLVVSGADEVRKFLGFRHIGGLKTWSPEAKARYLETEIEDAYASGSTNPFLEVGRRVGSNTVGVRGPYLALKVLRTAREEFSLVSEAQFVLRERFGVWTRLLNSAEVRAFIGLGETLEYDSIQDSLRTLDATGLTRVFSDLIPRAGATRAVLQDSRDATKYGRVIANDVARATLYSHNDLELAHQVVDRQSLSSRLATISKTLDLMTNGVATYEIDSHVLASAQGVSNSARSLVGAVRELLNEED